MSAQQSLGVVRALTHAAAALALGHGLLLALMWAAIWFVPPLLFFALLVGGPIVAVIAFVAALVARDRIHMFINGSIAVCYVAVWALLYWLLQWSFRWQGTGS